MADFIVSGLSIVVDCLERQRFWMVTEIIWYLYIKLSRFSFGVALVRERNSDFCIYIRCVFARASVSFC